MIRIMIFQMPFPNLSKKLQVHCIKAVFTSLESNTERKVFVQQNFVSSVIDIQLN